MYVVIKKEYEHDDKERPGSRGKKTCEGCIGIFKDMHCVQYEVAAIVFDELHYGLVSSETGNVTVGGSKGWMTDRDNDEMHVLEVSVGNTDFVFKAYYLDDGEEEDEA